jgi:hypothetical protein
MAIDLDDGDWIPVFRKLRESWIWKEADYLRAWMDILMMANRRESTIRFRGAVLHVEPGQLATTYQSLAKRWGWSRARVQRFLAALAEVPPGEKAGTIELRRLEFVRAEAPSGEHVNVHVNVHVNGSATDTKSGTWKDSESDRSIALLTIVNSPVRSKWLAKRARETTPPRAPERAPKEASGEHVDERSVLHNPRGERETATAGQGETSSGAAAAPTPTPSGPAATGDGDAGGSAVAVDDGRGRTFGGVQEVEARPGPRDPLLGQVSPMRGAELLEDLGVDPSQARSLAVLRPVGELLDICVEARRKRKPAGFARRSIERGWIAPMQSGLEVEKLLAVLRADAAGGGRFQRLAGTSILSNRVTERLPGEDETAFVRRVQESIVARRKGAQG